MADDTHALSETPLGEPLPLPAKESRANAELTERGTDAA
jgi:hypothetical protein